MTSSPTRMVESQRLHGKVFVFAGRMLNVTRREAVSLVHSQGGATRHTVTRRTSHLVIGSAPTPSGARRSNQKVGDARRLMHEGAEIRIIEEFEFLEMLGIESASKLRDRYYTGQDIRRIYGLDNRALRQLEELAVVSPILKTSTERYYTFSDLLVMRQIHTGTRHGASLQSAARRLMQQRAGQIGIRFEQVSAGRAATVIPLAAPPSVAWTAEDWYNLGCDHDEDPTETAQAMEAYRKTIELDPYHVGALINLGNLLYDAGKIVEARSYYERALASDEDNAIANFNLGNVYDDLGEYDSAIRYFHEAIRLRPENADAHFNLGLVYDRVGKVEQVRKHMHLYLRLSPTGDMADIAREYLQLTERESDLTHVD